MAPLPWRGIHHLALATPDIDATFRFYSDVMGMSVSAIFASREGRGRHGFVFVKPGNSDSLGLHFFERPTTAMQGGPFLHIAFRLPDIAAGLALRERVHTHSVAITEIPELGSFILRDNNGLMLEVTWPQE